MAEHIFDQLAREARERLANDLGHALSPSVWFHHDQPHPETSAVPAAAYLSAVPAAAIPTPTLEGHTPEMLEELRKLLDLADENALRAVNAVLTHPEGPAVLADVAAVAGIHCPPGTITSAASGLKAVLLVAGQHVDPIGAAPTTPDAAAPQA